MTTPNRITSIEKPDAIIKLGNNSYYFNYDIQPITLQIVKDEVSENVDGYSYVQVHIQGQPNYKDCVKNVIRAYVSQEEEFDLINSHNSSTMGIAEDSKAESEYTQYLQLLQTIKSNVHLCFND